MKKLDPVVQEMIDKTYAELAQNHAKTQDSRNWKDPEGYRYLFPWSNAVLLRFLIRKFTDSLPKKEFRRKTQFDDAGSSVVRNIEEGFKRPTTKEYLSFLGFSQASLEETKGNTRESADDGLLKSAPGSSLAGIGINLRDFRDSLLKDSKGLLKDVKLITPYRPLNSSNNPLRDPKGLLKDGKGNLSFPPLNSSNHPLKSSNSPLREDKGLIKDIKGYQRDFSYHPPTILYPPLKNILAEDLTYEIFLELINKTDYLLRQLVISLEKKLEDDQKGYQIDQIRLNQRAKGD